MGVYYTCSICGDREKGGPPGCGCVQEETRRNVNRQLGATVLELILDEGSEGTYLFQKFRAADQTIFYLRTCLRSIGGGEYEDQRKVVEISEEQFYSQPETPSGTLDSDVEEEPRPIEDLPSQEQIAMEKIIADQLYVKMKQVQAAHADELDQVGGKAMLDQALHEWYAAQVDHSSQSKSSEPTLLIFRRLPNKQKTKYGFFTQPTPEEMPYAFPTDDFQAQESKLLEAGWKKQANSVWRWKKSKKRSNKKVSSEHSEPHQITKCSYVRKPDVPCTRVVDATVSNCCAIHRPQEHPVDLPTGDVMIF